MVSLFIVEKNPEAVMPYWIKHVPSGIGAGAFRYIRHARAAAQAMNAVAATHDISTAEACQVYETLAALLEARNPHVDADRAQDRAQRKREEYGR